MMGIKKSLQRGFTIVEILVVIIIVGILAVLTIVSYNASQRTAQNTRTVAMVKSVTEALNGYYTKNGTYPVDAPGSSVEICLTQSSEGCGKLFTTGDCTPYGITNPGTISEVESKGFLSEQLGSFLKTTIPEISHPAVLSTIPLDANCSITREFTGPIYASGCTVTFANGKPLPIINANDGSQTCSTGTQKIARAYVIVYYMMNKGAECQIPGSYDLTEHYSQGTPGYSGTICMYFQGNRQNI